MSENTEIPKIKEIWNALNLIGYAIIFFSLIAGLYILAEFGTMEVPTDFGISMSEPNIVGMASGIAVMLQGVVTGVLLLAFSALGKSVNNIENRVIEKPE